MMSENPNRRKKNKNQIDDGTSVFRGEMETHAVLHWKRVANLVIGFWLLKDAEIAILHHRDRVANHMIKFWLLKDAEITLLNHNSIAVLHRKRVGNFGIEFWLLNDTEITLLHHHTIAVPHHCCCSIQLPVENPDNMCRI